MSTSVEYIVALPAGMKLLNANDRTHWRTRARVTDALRQAAKLTARNARVPAMRQATIKAVLHPHDKRHRDAHNWAPSFKAAIDGIVDAGVLPDDDERFLLSVQMVLGSPVRHGQVALHITPVGGVA